MAEIDYKKVYQDYINLGYSPAEATNYTAYKYLTKKSIPTTQKYSIEQWYKNTAPDYYSAVRVGSSSEYAPYTKRLTKAESPEDVFKIVNAANTAGLLSVNKSFETPSQYREYLMGLYNQKVQADKQIKQQEQKFSPTIQGLPSMNWRYGVANSRDGRVVKLQEAADYVDAQTKAFGKTLKSGVHYKTKEEFKTLTDSFKSKLSAKLNSKLASSTYTPFAVEAWKRVTGAK